MHNVDLMNGNYPVQNLGGNMLIIFHTYSQISRYHSHFCSVTLKSLHMQLISLAYHQDRKHRKEPAGSV